MSEYDSYDDPTQTDTEYQETDYDAGQEGLGIGATLDGQSLYDSGEQDASYDTTGDPGDAADPADPNYSADGADTYTGDVPADGGYTGDAADPYASDTTDPAYGGDGGDPAEPADPAYAGDAGNPGYTGEGTVTQGFSDGA